MLVLHLVVLACIGRKELFKWVCHTLKVLNSHSQCSAKQAPREPGPPFSESHLMKDWSYSVEDYNSILLAGTQGPRPSFMPQASQGFVGQPPQQPSSGAPNPQGYTAGGSMGFNATSQGPPRPFRHHTPQTYTTAAGILPLFFFQEIDRAPLFTLVYKKFRASLCCSVGNL